MFATIIPYLKPPLFVVSVGGLVALLFVGALTRLGCDRAERSFATSYKDEAVPPDAFVYQVDNPRRFLAGTGP